MPISLLAWEWAVLQNRFTTLYNSRMNKARNKQLLLQQVGSSELFRLLNLLPDISFFVKDLKGRFVALNQRGCEYCGIQSEREALGKTDLDFMPKRRAEEYMRDDREVLRTGQPMLNRIESAPEAEGSPRLVITCKIPLRNSQGKVIGLAGFSRLTEQVRERPQAIENFSRVMEYIHARPHEAISSQDLAQMMGLSTSQFDRTFRKYFGTSPRQYLLRVRVEAACRQLAASNQSIAAIALATGFHDHAHLTRTFRQVMGQSPSEYRREHQRPTLSTP